MVLILSAGGGPSEAGIDSSSLDRSPGSLRRGRRPSWYNFHFRRPINSSATRSRPAIKRKQGKLKKKLFHQNLVIEQVSIIIWS